MNALDPFRALSTYSRQANSMLLSAAAKLNDAQLDQPLDLGLGSVRRICRHLLAGEATWLQRMSGEIEAKWPDEKTPLPISRISQELEAVAAQREQFIDGLDDVRLATVQTYRDSKGSLFTATLQDMLIQNFTHSTHHRAQIVNGIKRVGGEFVELDYMYLTRIPV